MEKYTIFSQYEINNHGSQSKMIKLICSFLFYITILVIPFSSYAKTIVITGAHQVFDNSYEQYLNTLSISEIFQAKDLSVFFGGSDNSFFGNKGYDVFFVKGDDFAELKLVQSNDLVKRDLDKETILESLKASKSYNDFLFVLGHGVQRKNDNCVPLWLNDSSQKQEESFLCLEDIKAEITKKQPVSKKIIYVASECYSGNFHTLTSLNTENKQICGITSTTENLMSTGCQKNNKDLTKGFIHNFITTLKNYKKSSQKISVADMHKELFLNNKSIDVPLKSSDYFLLQVRKENKKSFKEYKEWNILSKKAIEDIKARQSLLVVFLNKDSQLKEMKLDHNDQIIDELNAINSLIKVLKQNYFNINHQYWRLRNKLYHRWLSYLKKANQKHYIKEKKLQFIEDRILLSDRPELAYRERILKFILESKVSKDDFDEYYSKREIKFFHWIKKQSDEAIMKFLKIRNMRNRLASQLSITDIKYSKLYGFLLQKQALEAYLFLIENHKEKELQRLSDIETCEKEFF